MSTIDTSNIRGEYSDDDTSWVAEPIRVYAGHPMSPKLHVEHWHWSIILTGYAVPVESVVVFTVTYNDDDVDFTDVTINFDSPGSLTMRQFADWNDAINALCRRHHEQARIALQESVA